MPWYRDLPPKVIFIRAFSKPCGSEAYLILSVAENFTCLLVGYTLAGASCATIGGALCKLSDEELL